MTDFVGPVDAGRDARLERERQFHNELAAVLLPQLMPPDVLGPLEHAMLSEARIGNGTRVLDLGCGSGGLTLRLLQLGADVTGLDISPGMVDVAHRRVEMFGGGRTAELIAAPFEQSKLPSASFDVVVGRFILHHLDAATVGSEIARVLRPGGRAIFAENSASNPILMAARTHVAGRFGVPRFGTADEQPLSLADIERLRPHFVKVDVSYPVFEFFRLFDRQVMRFHSPSVTRVCNALDRCLARIPGVRRYSFRLVLSLLN